MKRILHILIGVTAVLSVLAGCKKGFLDPPPTSIVDAKTIFSNQLQTAGFVANIYASMSGALDNWGNGQGFAQASDEAESSYGYLPANGVNVGAVDATTNIDGGVYTNRYTQIRKCNVLLTNREFMTFDANLKAQYIAETQFLRAFFYSEMLIRYGGVPLSTSPLGAEDINDVAALELYKKNLVRNSFEDCVNFIVQQLDSAAAVLPWFPVDDQQRGKATGAAALAMKAKVLLFAASPLFNSVETAAKNNNLIGYTSYDPNRWKLAADACREFFSKNNDNGNWHRLFNNYETIFTESRDANNREPIFYRQSNAMDQTFFNPPGRLAGFAHFAILLNLVDKYEMANGKQIADPTSGYNEQQWWANRDPRLAMTVVKTGDLWRSQNFPMEFWYKDAAGTPGRDWGVQVPTAILMRKFLRRDANSGVQKWHFIRYGELFLMLAEAENEMNGATPQVYAALDSIRKRPTVSMPSFPAGLTKEQMRERIRNERAVELSFEAQRFFDVRRWLIAEQTENGPVYGFRVEKKADNSLTHERYLIETRRFSPRMYLYPIPEAEIFKGANIVQNPGY